VLTHIEPVIVRESYLTESKLGPLARNNWDQFFEKFINMVIAQVNVNYKYFDIKALDDSVELTAGQFPNNTISASF